MKILLTGASSFTGMWFASRLVEAGHDVAAILRGRELSSYSGVRRQRVLRLRKLGAEIITDCTFGDEKFINCLASGIDILCHHAAHVENYKSVDFDVTGALESNTRNVRGVFEAGLKGGMRGVVLTGSVFEPDEGVGNQPMRAFSPYGLSKGLTWQVFRYWATILESSLHKFVIPNPFGPYEEERFCAYLMRKWIKGETAQVNTPSYVRDNIHVSLLSKAYAAFVGEAGAARSWGRLGPSGYVESQGAFASRFASEIAKRLPLRAPLQLGEQMDFSEPLIRINSDRCDTAQLGWDETAAWDELADYYQETYL